MFSKIVRLLDLFDNETFNAKIHQIFLIIFSLVNFLFIGYLIHVSYYNRPAMDDFYMISMQRERGIWGAVEYMYFNWSGRFASVWTLMIAVKAYEYFQNLSFWTISFISLGLIVFYKGISNIFKPLTKTRNDQWLIFNLSTFLLISFIISNYRFSTFYWFCASVGYFGGILFPCLGAIIIFSASRHFWAIFSLIICAIFTGSLVENMTLAFLGLLSLYLIVLLLYRNKGYNWLRNWVYAPHSSLHLWKTLLAWLFGVSAMLFSFFAPGNQIRMKFAGIHSWEQILKGLRQNLPYFFHDILPMNSQYFLCFIPILVYIGSYFRKNEKIDENRFLGEVILSIPFFVCLMLLCLLPILFSFKAIGNDRTLTIVAFFVVIFVAYFSFQLGYRTLFSRKIALFFAIMCLLLLAYGARYRWTNEVYGAKIYAEHFDRTIDYLLELKAKKHRQPVGIDPITLPPGSLERNSFSADTLFWLNKDFANAYQLGYKVYSK